MSRLPLPGSVKRFLIPIWNEGHRIGWLVRDYLSAILHGSWDHCSVCGGTALMLYRRRIIPPKLVTLWGLSPEVAEALARKESSHCSNCGAQLRARRLAEVLLKVYPGRDGKPHRSIQSWVLDDSIRRLTIAEINKVDGLHDQLSQLPGLNYSDFSPDTEPGTIADGVRSEDLTRLTYPDESFDLVVTSESLEHVPDLDKALAEIRRVLKPGGRHVFTIPQIPGVPTTFPRTIIRPDGTREDWWTPICHPGGDVGYPVFTEFGEDFPNLLEQAGFEVEVFFGPNREDDLAQVYSARKPGGVI